MKKFPLFVFITLILFMPLFFINAKPIIGVDGDTINGIIGVCGSAEGDIFSTAPNSTNADLCSIGLPSSVSTNLDNYTWSCYGINGGPTVPCLANKTGINTPIDGVCGFSDGGTFFNKSTKNLCIIGNPSEVLKGFNKYLWECSGIYNGNPASCSADIKIIGSEDGVCGASQGKIFSSKPTEDLCVVGNPSLIFEGYNDYTWNCSGVRGGIDASCSALIKSQVLVDGVCGGAKDVGSKEEPTENLCSKGNVVAINKKDGNWIWICKGTGTLGEDSPKCTAPIITNTDSDSGGGLDSTDNADTNNGAGNQINTSSKAGGLMPECPADGCGFKEVIILINNVIKFLLKDIAIPLAAIVFMYAGFLLITAGGDPGKLTKAKAMLRNVLIGFVIALAAWLIINTVLSSLGVTTSLLDIGK